MSYLTASQIGLCKKVKPLDNKPLDIKTTGLPEKSQNPKVWGPLKWYDFHNSAENYPINPTKHVRELMMSRILCIPYELPCKECQVHASDYITKFTEKELEHVVSSRSTLVKFFIDFHNVVNVRLGKPVWKPK